MFSVNPEATLKPTTPLPTGMAHHIALRTPLLIEHWGHPNIRCRLLSTGTFFPRALRCITCGQKRNARDLNGNGGDRYERDGIAGKPRRE